MKTAREALEKLIESVPEFAKTAQPIFEKNGYTWASCGIPSVLKIESTLYSLLEELEKSTKGNNRMFHFVGTGRLWVELIRYNDEWHGRLLLTAEWVDVY